MTETGIQKAPLTQPLLIARMAHLENRFGRELSAPVRLEYMLILNSELDDAGLIRGTHAAIRYSTFFPSPQEIIDYANGGAAEERAALAWDSIMERLTGGYELLTEPGTMARTVLAKLGGSKVVSDSRGYDLSQLGKRFRERYVHAIRRTDAAPEFPGLTPPAALPEEGSAALKVAANVLAALNSRTKQEKE